MHLRTILIACTLLVCGCESVGVAECRGQNWYRLGLNDGKADAKDERERYVKSCGTDFNPNQYDEGYKAGAGR
jgi:hypothetical protein